MRIPKIKTFQPHQPQIMARKDLILKTLPKITDVEEEIIKMIKPKKLNLNKETSLKTL